MAKFKDVKTLQKFASVHAALYSPFNLDRHLTSRSNHKLNRSAALAERQRVMA